jgi:hypothetical protein
MNELEWRPEFLTRAYPMNPPEEGEKLEVVHTLAAREESHGDINFQYTGWDYKACVTKLAARKWRAQIIGGTQDGQHKTFRTLKAAKAYALAIVRLNQ